MSASDSGVITLRARLRADLKQAMLAREADVTATLRSALAALDNAEAVAVSDAPATATSEHVAGTLVGLGVGEISRRQLSLGDAHAVLAAEIAERQDGADELDRAGRANDAARLRRQAATLQRYVD